MGKHIPIIGTYIPYVSDIRVKPKEGVEKKARKNEREKEKEKRGRNFRAG